MKRIFSKENLWALAFALILVWLVILSSREAPLWIYQGF
jgi:predicted nucleic acid-binding Zn ribbon protein